MTVPTPKRPMATKPDPEPEKVTYDRVHQDVLDWRTHWLKKAGWTDDRADFIAALSAADLLEYGFTQKEADRVAVVLWRQACEAIKCGNETTALYLLGLTTEA